MGEESDSNLYIIIIFAILWLIGFFIHKIKSKKTIEELANFATTKNYVYHSKLDSVKTKFFDLPKFYADSTVHNYIEFPENDWLSIWGDCEKYIRHRGTVSSSYSSFFLFKFNSITIPDFEIRDNNGIVDSLASNFFGKTIKLDNEFNSSYVLTGYNEKQVTQFFTPKIRKAFLSMDKNNLPSERNLNLSDLGNLITFHINMKCVNFFGKDNRLFLFCSYQTSLSNRQKIYKLASEIAKTLVKELGKETSQSSSSNEEESQDEISQYLNSQIKNNSSSSKPNQSSNQISQPTINNQLTPNLSNEKQIPVNSNYYSNTQTTNEGEISPADQLLWLSAMMIIDKDIHRNELKNIVEYGINLGLSKIEIEQIINMAKTQSNSLLHKLKISNLPRSEKLMRMLIRVAFADGKIAPQELEFIRFAAQKMNFHENELKIILAEEKNNFNK